MNACGNWNEELIPQGGTYPRQYIEASASSPSCMNTNSSFNFVHAKLDISTRKYVPPGHFRITRKDEQLVCRECYYRYKGYHFIKWRSGGD